MKEIILEKLSEIERKEDVKILHCAESGSRAWGFASPDSDYDVRFVYVRRPEFYLKLEKTRDVIEWQCDDVLDINGWDLQKSLRLLYKSNPTLFEWNGSPIVYKTTEEWERVRGLINDYFMVKHGLYHYISTAKSNYREYMKADEVRLKKYFYVLRPILACRWIIDRKCPPPMLFSELAETELDKELLPEVNSLIEMKMKTPETGTGKRIDKLNEYIERQLDEIQREIDKTEYVKNAGWEKLDALFLSIVFDKSQ